MEHVRSKIQTSLAIPHPILAAAGTAVNPRLYIRTLYTNVPSNKTLHAIPPSTSSLIYLSTSYPVSIYPTSIAFPPPNFPCGPSSCASSTATLPAFTASTASGSKRPSSSAVDACPAQHFPPDAACAIPE